MNYTLDELIKSTCSRARFNLDLARKATSEEEKNRFLFNVDNMIDSISYAIEHGDKSVLIDNRDW